MEPYAPMNLQSFVVRFWLCLGLTALAVCWTRVARATPLTFAAAVKAAKEAKPALNGEMCKESGLDFVRTKNVVDMGDLSSVQGSRPNPDSTSDSCPLVLLAASVYSKISWDDIQLEVLTKQHDAAMRLVKVEKMRIIAHVDDELLLFKAELSESESRERKQQIEAEAQELRELLGSLLGLPWEHLEVAPESIPEMTIKEVADAERDLARLDDGEFRRLRYVIARLRAARDSSQITYVLAQRDAVRAAALGKVTIGDELTKKIQADGTFIEMLKAAGELQRTQFRLLDCSHLLDAWVETESVDSQAGRPQVGISLDHAIASDENSSRSSFSGGPHGLLPGIIVLPSKSVLTERSSVQMAAITTGLDGGADVTATATWESSNESVVIVSSFGLMTTLRPGQSTITVVSGPAVKSRTISVEAESHSSIVSRETKAAR